MEMTPNKPICILLTILISIVLLIGIFIALCTVNWQFTYKHGGTAFFRIGESKEDVISSMITHNISVVTVLPDTTISVRASNEVFELKGSPGIEYISPTWNVMSTDNLKSQNQLRTPGNIDIRFTNNAVSSLFLFGPPQVREYYKNIFWEGESEDEVLNSIGVLLKEHPGSEVYNIILLSDPRFFLNNKYAPLEIIESGNQGWTIQKRDTSADITKLRQYNVWHFGIRRLSGIDDYMLYFDGNRLKKIVSRKILLPIISL